MKEEKVNLFLMTNGTKLPEDKLPYIRERLLEVDDTNWNLLSMLQFNDPSVALLLSIFLGYLGVDRFYIGDIGLGVGKLLTCGGMGFWMIVDWFLIMGATKEKNFIKLQTYLF